MNSRLKQDILIICEIWSSFKMHIEKFPSLQAFKPSSLEVFIEKFSSLRISGILKLFINQPPHLSNQHIVILRKYGHGARNIRRL